jgi:hypothetical protein
MKGRKLSEALKSACTTWDITSLPHRTVQYSKRSPDQYNPETLPLPDPFHTRDRIGREQNKFPTQTSWAGIAQSL